MIKKFLCLILIFAAAMGHARETVEQYVKSGEAELFCRALGEGKPLVVLHGGPGLSHDYLLPQMEELSNHYQVIFYDQRGCGRSKGEISDTTITMKNYIDDLEAVRKFMGAAKISLLGHSWGGFLAMNYAIAYPERVERLILSNSCPSNSEGFALFLQEWMKRMGPYMGEFGAIRSSSEFQEGTPEVVERYNRLVFRIYCFNPEKVNLLNLKLTPAAAVNGEKVYAIFSKTVLEKPYSVDINCIRAPTLIIHGDVDPIPPVTALFNHENISGSKFVLMKDCGHFPYVEDPTVYFQQIEQFLNSD